MIKGAHTMFFSSKPEELRAFFRDIFGLTGTDVGRGWLIFDLPEADLGVHPTQEDREGSPSGTAHVSFYCDDLEQTMTELKARGAEFTQGPEDLGWGLVTYIKAPGDFSIMLQQPRYQK